MLERQDIDALLISALYGELTPADEARLNAHLESHPADKSALADLTSARHAIRESRFLTVQIEPPQAISALLLQEASRLAPAKAVAQEAPKSESWFARFVMSFARHPAMAAAAMLVLVVGVAGVMYARQGDKGMMAERTVDLRESAAAPAGAPAPEPPSAIAEEAKALEQNAGSAFEANLVEGKPADVKADPAAAPAKDQAKLEGSDEISDKKAAAKQTRTYIGVPTERPQPQPKELESPADFGGDRDSARRAKGGVATGSTAVPENRNEKRDSTVVATPAPPPPPRAPQATAPRGAGGAIGGEDGLKVSDEETTWAREQHVKVANAVKANNCKDATTLAVQLSNRAPGYYTQNVENDRALKQCMTYINAEREKAEAQRARTLQKRNADEADRARRAAPPTTNSK